MCDFLQNESVDTSISKLYLESDLADVNFVFKDAGATVLVPAHKIILASGSSVFRAMFFGLLPEKGTVDIVDATAEEFKEFLQLFYLRKIKLTMYNMEGVTRLADKYDMLECLNSCAAFLKTQFTDNNILWGYQLAISLNNQKLKQFCESKISKLSADIFKTEAFLNCDRNVLRNILMMNEMGCEEFDIFKACMAWAKTACRKKQLNENDSENLKNQLADCIYLIQFGKMAKDEAGEILNNKLYANMFDRDELLDITSTSLLPKFVPNIFEKSTRTNLSFSNNKNPELRVNRRIHGHGYNCLKGKEVTRFTSNTPLLLGKIKFCLNTTEDFNFDLVKCSSIETLYSGRVNRSSQDVNFDKGILIEAQEVYEIQVNVPSSMVGLLVRTAFISEDVVRMNTDITIKFPNSKYRIVSWMSFKQM